METMQYKITVIIPVYNVEQYIERCLQSVIHQTYSEPFECILIDDCSPDKSMNIVQNIVDNYHGHIVFNIIHHEQNGGLSAARNTGINNSKGMYLLFVDSDDYIDKRCLELFDNQLSLHPGVTMVLGNAQNNRTNTIEICKELPQHCSNNLKSSQLTTAISTCTKVSFLCAITLHDPVNLRAEFLDTCFLSAMSGRLFTVWAAPKSFPLDDCLCFYFSFSSSLPTPRPRRDLKFKHTG